MLEAGVKMEDYVFSNTKSWADFVVNDLGCNDLKLQILKLKGADILATKRKSYWELSDGYPNKILPDAWDITSGKFCEMANNFSGVDVFIFLDYDGTVEGYFELIKRLKADKLQFYAYKTNSNRCKHIHLFYPKLRGCSLNKCREIKELIIEEYNCEGLKASSNHNLPICYPAPKGKEPIHWKTNEPIKLIKI